MGADENLDYEDISSFESAQYACGLMGVIRRSWVRAEKQKDCPDQDKIRQWEEEARKFVREQIKLGLDDTKEHERIFREYHPQINADFPQEKPDASMLLSPDPQELEEIYKQYEADALADCQPQEQPTAIITVGQPDSVWLTDNAKSELKDRGGYLLVDAGILQMLHPSYGEFLRAQALDASDKTAAELTNDVALVWAKRLIQAGMEGKRNLIIAQ